MLQEEISCHRKKFLSQEKNSCHRKIILVTGRKFLAKVGNFMSQQIVFHVDKHTFLEEISCTRRNFILWWFFYRKKIPSHEEICFTHRNFLSRKKFTFQGKKSFNRRNYMTITSLFNWKSRKLIYPWGKQFEQKKEAEI